MNKFGSYLGFAKKSGNLVMGSDTCIISMKKRKIKLLVIAENISPNSMEKLIRAAENTSTVYRIFGDADELSHCAGSPGRTVFGVTDDNFAKILINEIDNLKIMKGRCSNESENWSDS